MHSLNITRCIKHGVKHKVHQVQRKQTDSHHKVCSTGTNITTQARLSIVIGQLRYQSATTPSRVTHAVDAVTAHRCHELWSHTHVAE